MSRIERRADDPLMVRLPDGTDVPAADFAKQKLTKEQKKAGFGGMPNRAMRREGQQHFARQTPRHHAPEPRNGFIGSGPSSKAVERARRKGRKAAA